MGHFIPTNATANAEVAARLFFDRIITIHGIPDILISDRDPKFTSNFWKELMGFNIPLALTYYVEASQRFPCSATETLQGPRSTVPGTETTATTTCSHTR
ncbi:unnamed protein product [Closterium sp. NIES-54]